MVQNAVLSVTVTACVVALSACSSTHYVQRGADLYSAGRYVEADEVFEHSEPRVAGAPIEQRASYAAYRGATFIALGDLQHAQRWLSVASEIEHARPGTLRPEERAFLDGAWRALANRMPTPTPAAMTSVMASSSQVPSPSLEPAPSNTRLEQRSLVPQ